MKDLVAMTTAILLVLALGTMMGCTKEEKPLHVVEYVDEDVA